MVASRKLPPSERDFQVYRLLVIEGCSTYEAAECFKISQTRVRQVQRKVVDWAAEVLPPETEVKTENLLRVTQIAASERLEQAYADAIEQWRLTNQPRYLSAVLRIVQTEVKLQLPARAGTLEALLAAGEEIDERERAADEAAAAAKAAAEAVEARARVKTERSASDQTPASIPPVVDCSVDSAPRPGVVIPPRPPAHVTRPKASKLGALLADDPFWKAEERERVRTLLTPAESAGGS
jgi:hypothetical protein